MVQDPNLQKEIWDARVKIVYGRFIMNAFTAFFAIGIIALLLDNFVMGQMGDAFIKPVILNWGLPITGITLVVGFITNFLPKKKKITLFTKILYEHRDAENQIAFPAGTIEAECFNDVSTLGFRDGVRYRVWKTEKETCFFPVKPTIERLNPYERGPVSFSVITLSLNEIQSLETGSQITRSYTTYDERKKPVVGNQTHSTVRLNYGTTSPVAILFDSNLANLIATAPVVVSANVSPTIKTPIVSSTTQIVQENGDIETKLQKLQSLFDKGLITEQEYKERKSKILDNL
jgi:hypothetical protein